MLSSLDRQKKAYVFAALTVLSWSSIATALKLGLRYADNFQLLFISVVSACLVLLLILVFQKKTALIASLAREDYLRLLGLGLLNPFFYYLVLFKAYDLLPAQVAQSLNYTWAITLMFLSIPILGHRVSRNDVLATLACYGGVLVICLGGRQFPSGGFSMAGIALALGSTIIWSLYWLYKAKDKVDPVLGLFLSFLFGLPFVSIACMYFSSIGNIHPYALLSGIYVGLFEMGITFVLWLSALQMTSNAAKISTMIFIAPFLSLVFIHFVLGESIASTTVIGLVVIVLGLLIQRRDEKG